MIDVQKKLVVMRSVPLGDLWPAGCWDRTGVFYSLLHYFTVFTVMKSCLQCNVKNRCFTVKNNNPGICGWVMGIKRSPRANRSGFVYSASVWCTFKLTRPSPMTLNFFHLEPVASIG